MSSFDENLSLKIERYLLTMQSAMTDTLANIESIWIAGPLLSPDHNTQLESYGELRRQNLPLYLNQKESRYQFVWEKLLPEFDPDYDYYFELSTGREGQWDAVNPQLLAYVNETIQCGLDTNHRRIWLDPALAGQTATLRCTLYTGMTQGDLSLRIILVKRSKDLHKAYWDLKVIGDALKAMSKDNPARWLLSHKLEDILSKTHFGGGPFNRPECILAAKNLSMTLWAQCYGQDLDSSQRQTVHAIGHTHIDVAWLWDLAQTQEKVVRSFATALDLQNRYPFYQFMASQPILYEMLEEASPDLMAKIKIAHEKGLWETEGGMYLEADCNLTGGESLIRQFESGGRFYADRFQSKSRSLWLPDVFGYSAALPQILKGFGIELFVTSKISWNDTNKLPFDAFIWQGIDGSRIPTQFITTASMETLSKGDHRTIYEGNMTPSEVMGCDLRNQQRSLQPHALMPFGYGDGGGGATEDMLEMAKRMMAGLPGMPTLQMSTVNAFANAFLETDLNQLPVWRGELYLEYHRGTYTTNGGIKRRFRQLEDLLLNVERRTALLLWAGEISKTQAIEMTQSLKMPWQVLLLNAFHDILPGTSIEKVYTDAYNQLDQASADVKAVLAKLSATRNNDLNVTLTSHQERNTHASLPLRDYSDKAFTQIFIPEDSTAPQGYSDIKTSRESLLDLDLLIFSPVENVIEDLIHLETTHYNIAFNTSGDLSQLFDKTANRSVFRPDSYGLRLMAYEDRPLRWDAWDIDLEYKRHPLPWQGPALISIAQGDSRALVIKVERHLHKSWITQLFVFYQSPANKRIDVVCSADWHEHQVLLRAEADLQLNLTQANYDIQFGHVSRPNDDNHSYHQAMFEVCAQHWANVSEGDYHVTWMSNEKFGYSALGTELGMSLIKSPTWPNPNSDQGHHHFAFALLPASGQVYLPAVHQEAMAFCKGCSLTHGSSLTQLWQPNLPLHLTVRSCRVLENGCVELRLNEIGNSRGKAVLTLPPSVQSVIQTNLNGDTLKEMLLENQTIIIDYSPFEIITLVCK